MHVCMYVCMHACMYECMYICIKYMPATCAHIPIYMAIAHRTTVSRGPRPFCCRSESWASLLGLGRGPLCKVLQFVTFIVTGRFNSGDMGRSEGFRTLASASFETAVCKACSLEVRLLLGALSQNPLLWYRAFRKKSARACYKPGAGPY